MPKTLSLDSNFHELYDPWFDLNGEYTLHRRTDQPPYRRGALSDLYRRMGLRIPRVYHEGQHTGNDVGSCRFFPGPVVVHDDETAHCGDRKRMEADIEPGKLCVQYIHPSEYGTSYRWLCIGKHDFWLRYRGKDWRSNVDSEIELLDIDVPFMVHQKQRVHRYAPLIAIDFVHSLAYGLYYAIDLNTAPGICGTGILEEEWLTPRGVVDALKEWYA